MNRQGRNDKKRRYYKAKRCFLTDNKILWIDYKNEELLSRFINRQGKIHSAKNTGTKTKHQRSLSVAIKRARHIGILPFTQDPTQQTQFTKKN